MCVCVCVCLCVCVCVSESVSGHGEMMMQTIKPSLKKAWREAVDKAEEIYESKVSQTRSEPTVTRYQR